MRVCVCFFFLLQVFKDSLIRQTTGDKKNPFRYFTKQELKELFTLEDTHSSSTQLQLQSLHSSACRSDPELQCHVSALKGMNTFGVSRHDLLFSNEEDEDTLQDEETHYIDQRVQKAQELVQAESQLNSLMLDSVGKSTEPTWLRLSRQQGPARHAAMGDGKTTPSSHSLSPPAVVDLTQSGSDELEISMDGGMQDKGVIDLSTQATEDSLVEQGIKSITDKQSVIVEDKSVLTHSDSDPIMHISPFKQSDSSLVLLVTESKIPKAFSQVELGSPEAHVKPDPDASNALLEAELESSLAPTAESHLSRSMVGVESDSGGPMGAESFQGNFNLQLEDSAELLSEDKQEVNDQEETELSTGGEDFQLQMDDTREGLNESHYESMRQKSVVSTSADESLLWPTKKKKLRVIYDSEEDGHDEEEAEQPVLAISPLAGGFMGLECSTPKSVLNNGSNRRCSMNTSIASRRSLVQSLLQDMEEEEEPEKGEETEDECSYEGVVLSQASDANGTHANESVLEEAEPSGETLNSERTSEGEEEEQEEDDRVKGFTDASTDVELASSEVLDQCAPSEVQSLSASDIKHPQEMFDSLVRSGKQCLAEGRKQEALDFFLNAIDINTGDPEIQLLIIQLYRHLGH